MKAPFPWFGGKRRVADVVWRSLGDVDNYVEPFAGSLAVLLERPRWHTGQAETVNDADAFLANFWRALAADPAEVAYWCDWPVNEADLESRHLWLVNEGRNRIRSMFVDPEFYDAKVTSDNGALDNHSTTRRIILAGYEPEHIDHMPTDWRMITYSASKSYGSAAGGGDNSENRHLERLWLSPACIDDSQQSLFGAAS